MARFKALNLPNWLTAFRIFCVPLVVVVLLTEFSFEQWFFFNREELAVGIFVLASLTDLLDGYLARKRSEVTTLGQLLDPIADKLLDRLRPHLPRGDARRRGLPLVPAWLAVIIVGREFMVTGFRMIAAVHQVSIPAGVLGKWKMVVEVFAICFIIWGNQREWEWLKLTGEGLLYFVAFIAIISMVEYFVKFSRRIDLFQEDAGEEGHRPDPARSFLTGLVLVLPLVVTLWVLYTGTKLLVGFTAPAVRLAFESFGVEPPPRVRGGARAPRDGRGAGPARPPGALLHGAAGLARLRGAAAADPPGEPHVLRHEEALDALKRQKGFQRVVLLEFPGRNAGPWAFSRARARATSPSARGPRCAACSFPRPLIPPRATSSWCRQVTCSNST